MNSFAMKLRLKGMAEEDIYFAKLDRELIAALRQKKQQQASALSNDTKHSTQPVDCNSEVLNA